MMLVDLADGGRERVRQTIAGMDAIREATSSADAVIRGLGNRVKEIGAIVNVIDEVADETAALPLLQVAGQMLWRRRDEQRQVLLCGEPQRVRA